MWETLVPQLMRLGVLREIDQMQLASLCDSYSIMISARESMAKLPGEARMLVKTPNGAIQQNPLLSVINTQKQIIGRLATEFGLTPAARARLLQDAAPSVEDARQALEEILAQGEEEAVARAPN
jgi:P27 family predicted phage terminase small subunit